jgi:hypothetical protein
MPVIRLKARTRTTRANLETPVIDVGEKPSWLFGQFMS